MGEVVDLPPRDELIWVCVCGCQSWFIHQGFFKCTVCGSASSGPDDGDWKLPPIPRKPDRCDGVDVTSTDGTTDFAVRRFKQFFTGAGQLAVILYANGMIKHFAAGVFIDTDEDKAWLKSGLDDVYKDLTGR